MRRAQIVMVIVAIATGLLVLNAPLSWAQRGGPVKIGFVAPLSGGFAQAGKDMVDGFRLYLEQIGFQAADRKIELIIEDSEGVPTTALTKTRKLVEKDGVQIMSGGFLAATAYALAPYIDSKQVPMTYPVMAADDLTQRKRAQWVVRTGWNGSLPMHPFGEYAYQVLKLRKVAAIGPDFAFGWETLGGFQRTFEEAGGKIIQKIWYPLTAQDFGPYLPQISKEADAVFANFAGRHCLLFAKQYQEFGLKGKIPVIGTGVTTDEHILPAMGSMGDEAVGYVTALHYSAALQNPANKKFVETYREKFRKPPGYYSETCYTGAKWIVEAINAVHGDVENAGKVLEALKKVELKDIPRGPMRLDEFGNPIQNVYIRKVERVGGELQNTVIHTFPNVSQFWKYNPEEFLKLPAYSRDYPPLKP
jgi:branched-chain amino acid transport system substrate-binding protein